MRIGLNLLHTQRKLGGAWNYVQNVLEVLRTCDVENEFFLYCNEESKQLAPADERFHVFCTSLNMNRRTVRVLYEQTYLPLLGVRDKLDAMHWFANNCSVLPGVSSVATVYDLLARNNSQAKGPLSGIYIRAMLRYTTSQASVLCPMSSATADDIAKWYGTPAHRMVIIPNPLSSAFRPADASQIEQFRKKYGLPERFWVFVSVYRKHKNHQRLFQAFGRLKSMVPEGWPLVLRCDRKGNEELLDDMVRTNGIEGEVIWLPRLDDREMPVLYSAATASVFPSLFEGGGIPVMEAMGCGCPVAASDIPTTREFAKDAAVIFDPENVESIAEAMVLLQNEPDLRERCRQRGLRVVEAYRPRVVYQRLMKAYAAACGQ